MQRLAVAILQLPDWRTVSAVRIEDAQGVCEVALPLAKDEAMPPLEGLATITVDFAPERP